MREDSQPYGADAVAPARVRSGDERAGRSAADWYRTGETAFRLGQIDRARSAFERAVAVDPQLANAHYRLGQLAEHAGRVVDAAALYEETLRVQPTHVSAARRLEQLEEEMPSLALEPSGRGPVGLVSLLRQRYEQDSLRRPLVVLAFRLARDGDAQGRSRLPVEMRGRSLRGGIDDGDWVQLPADWRPGRVVRQLVNLTTDEKVVLAEDHVGRSVTAMVVVTALVVAAIIVIGALVMINVSRHF
jgi:hypothetical protein